MALRSSKKGNSAWTFHSPAATAQWGRRFAGLLQPGDVIALVGPLGAGKTSLVQSMVAALGYGRPITSPTFALANEYLTAKGAVYHMDMYRLSSKELERFPLEDYWCSGMSVIEWADKVRARWPAGTLEINLSIQGPGERKLMIRGASVAWQRRLIKLLPPHLNPPPQGGRRH